MAPGTFDVILQIDHREVKDVSLSTLERAFSRKNITYEVVNLVLGDYLWVARRKQPLGDGCECGSQAILFVSPRSRRLQTTRSSWPFAKESGKTILSIPLRYETL